MNSSETLSLTRAVSRPYFTIGIGRFEYIMWVIMISHWLTQTRVSSNYKSDGFGSICQNVFKLNNQLHKPEAQEIIL